MKLNLLILLSLFSLSAWSNVIEASLSPDNFCQARKDKSYFQKLLFEKDNRLAFTNQGGLIDGGTCWWHSRITRNAAYLAYFSPHKAKPTEMEAFLIVSRLRTGSAVVEIPGYHNLKEFSEDWEDTIQWHLNDWQIFDGFIGQSWINALAGKTKVTPNKLKSIMEETFKRVNQDKEVVFHKLQLPGIPAHAWLVVKMEKTENGYRLKVIDSNYRYKKFHLYERGDGSFYTSSYKNFVPYVDYTNEEKKLRKVVSNYCSK
jgi:hypothetical protein